MNLAVLTKTRDTAETSGSKVVAIFAVNININMHVELSLVPAMSRLCLDYMYRVSCSLSKTDTPS